MGLPDLKMTSLFLVQDLPNAMRTPEISAALQLHNLKQRCCIQPMCALNLLGFAEGMEWLCFEVAVRSTWQQHPTSIPPRQPHPLPPNTSTHPSAAAPPHQREALPACAPRERADARRAEPCGNLQAPPSQLPWVPVVPVRRRACRRGHRGGRPLGGLMH